tara:strand:+ start:1443 stop:2111 length:669 start_codon:yes stop_codon:yes gene_type:complete
MNYAELQRLQVMLGDNTTLLAVSKTFHSAHLREVHNLGLCNFGENRVQELKVKQQELSDLDIDWHFIGRLQSNKVAQLVGKVKLIHSVDRMKIWEILKMECIRKQVVQSCLIQVNISQEPAKGGVDIQKLDDFLEKIDEEGQQFCKIKGLMCIGSSISLVGEAKVRSEFQCMQNLFNKFKNKGFKHIKMEVLSMGMSADYKLAIEYGSTLVRLGSLVFGSRR